MDLLGLYFLLDELNIPTTVLNEDNLWSVSLSNNNDLPPTQKRHIIFQFDGMTKMQQKVFKSLPNRVFFEIRGGSYDVVSFDAPNFICNKEYENGNRFIYHKLKR